MSGRRKDTPVVWVFCACGMFAMQQTATVKPMNLRCSNCSEGSCSGVSG